VYSLVLFFSILPGPPLPIYECDKIIINYVYEDVPVDMRIKLTQVLFTNWDREKGGYIVRQYQIINRDELPSLDVHHIKNHYYYAYSPENCIIKARLFDIIHSDKDIEIEQHSLFENISIERNFGITPIAKAEYNARFKLLPDDAKAKYKKKIGTP